MYLILHSLINHWRGVFFFSSSYIEIYLTYGNVFSLNCELVSSCGFDLHLPDMLSIFSCAYWSSLCLLWKMPIQNLLCILIVLFFYGVELHKFFVYFEYLLFIWYIVCKYLLSFSRQYFVLLIISFVVQKHFSL